MLLTLLLCRWRLHAQERPIHWRVGSVL